MPNFPWPGRRDASAEDAALAALLSGSGEIEDLSASLRPAADVLAALRARPSGDELAGEHAAMAEFRDRVGMSDPALPTRRRRPSVLSSLLSAKAAAAALCVAVALGGAATAAYAGALPSSAQRLAHEFIGAPAAHHAMPGAHGSGGAAGSWARHRRHHHFRPGCFMPRPHQSWSASPSPCTSASPSPSPSPTPSCPPFRFRHHHFRPGCFMHGPHHSWSASPSPSASASPSPSPSPSCPPLPFRHHHFRHHHAMPHHFRHHRFPHPMRSPSPSPSATMTS
jgi:hypothetical protein